MPDALLAYFEALSRKCFVLIEYGVESTLDRTLERINRGHTAAESEEAIRRTAARGIYTGAHLILGLPVRPSDISKAVFDESKVESIMAGNTPTSPKNTSLTTVGLASKNAILIVEFAKDLYDRGERLTEAVIHAAKLRFRPILMTSMAFILGVVPLAVSSGAGAAGRNEIGIC